VSSIIFVYSHLYNCLIRFYRIQRLLNYHQHSIYRLAFFALGKKERKKEKEKMFCFQTSKEYSCKIILLDNRDIKCSYKVNNNTKKFKKKTTSSQRSTAYLPWNHSKLFLALTNTLNNIWPKFYVSRTFPCWDNLWHGATMNFKLT
jgi:hypothetical protein